MKHSLIGLVRNSSRTQKIVTVIACAGLLAITIAGYKLSHQEDSRVIQKVAAVQTAKPKQAGIDTKNAQAAQISNTPAASSSATSSTQNPANSTAAQANSKNQTTATSGAVSSNAAPYNPYTPLLVSSISISASGFDVTGCGSSSTYPWSYVITFSDGRHKDGVIIDPKWEYESTGVQAVSIHLPGFPLGTSIPASTVKIYDTVQSPGVEQNNSGSYRLRVHMTTPNEIYSNWIDVPQMPTC